MKKWMISWIWLIDVKECVNKAIENEAKEQSCIFYSMLLGTLGGSLLENLLAGKGMKVKIPERGAIRAGEGAIATSQWRGTIRDGQEF